MVVAGRLVLAVGAVARTVAAHRPRHTAPPAAPTPEAAPGAGVGGTGFVRAVSAVGPSVTHEVLADALTIRPALEQRVRREYTKSEEQPRTLLDDSSVKKLQQPE